MRDLVVRVRTTVGDFSLEAVMHAPGAGVTGVFGPSGSGKTTLVRCIAGLHRPRHGSIRWGGDVWQDDAKGTFVPPHARRVGYVSQHADLFPHLSVRGNLQYAATRAPAGPHDLSWHDVVTWLALDGMLDRAVTRLSGGERQRVALARALLAQPRLLLLDEPLSALDQPARQEVMRHLEPVLTRVALPVIYVSHALQEVARIADHFVWIRAGRVAEEGPVSRILGNVEFAKWIGDDRGVVLDGVIRDHDPQYELSTITTAVGDLLVPRRSEDPGTPIRVQIKARDVSVGLTPQESSSILNELALDVLETAELSPSDCLVRLGRPDAGETVVMAKITRKSMSHLGVEPGLRMFVRVKSVAVLD